MLHHPHDAAPRSTRPIAGDIEFRQLRHHTKNALQRILCQLAQSRDLQATVQGQRLISDLERRIHLVSTVSDALFGLTRAPGPLHERLERLCDAVVELLGDPDQFLMVSVTADPACPAALDETVLRIVHEFAGNAIKHGLYARSVGCITVCVERFGQTGVRVRVSDDGWGFACAPESGEGMRLATLLAAQAGGTVALACRDGLTTAEATMLPA